MSASEEDASSASLAASSASSASDASSPRAEVSSSSSAAYRAIASGEPQNNSYIRRYIIISYIKIHKIFAEQWPRNGREIYILYNNYIKYIYI